MKEPAHSLDELLFLLGRRPFVIWMIGQALLVSTIIVGARISRTLNPRTVNVARMRLVRGISYGSISILYPLVFCVYNIVAILDGLLYFQQASKLSVLHALLIAVGTVILLSGVLALSWRLGGEPTPTPVAQSALAPGMGFVDDTSEDDEDGDYKSDEEIAIGGERQALLQGDTLTPTTKYDKLLSATRLQRRGMTEADEIWGELEDDATRYPSSLPRRSASGISTTSRLRRSEGDATHETTSLLRSVTSRSNRSRHKRLGSSHFRRPSREQSPQTGAPKDTKPQSALGGWWRMEWWKGRRGQRPPPASVETPGSES
ncbi:hypothetical protein FGG08_002442 [Glutinoglossum americanum]|uniref:Uncharacterized protein n=1 Tax=Glutinoglossum americanum TaxID=1670608 RepID=A0A9P8I948_9PEZI|nr:hypothetical protein FGG08_002442 [Glutinoglossum americanum]